MVGGGLSGMGPRPRQLGQISPARCSCIPGSFLLLVVIMGSSDSRACWSSMWKNKLLFLWCESIHQHQSWAEHLQLMASHQSSIYSQTPIKVLTVHAISALRALVMVMMVFLAPRDVEVPWLAVKARARVRILHSAVIGKESEGPTVAEPEHTCQVAWILLFYCLVTSMGVRVIWIMSDARLPYSISYFMGQSHWNGWQTQGFQFLQSHRSSCWLLWGICGVELHHAVLLWDLRALSARTSLCPGWRPTWGEYGVWQEQNCFGFWEASKEPCCIAGNDNVIFPACCQHT